MQFGGNGMCLSAKSGKGDEERSDLIQLFCFQNDLYIESQTGDFALLNDLSRLSTMCSEFGTELRRAR